MGEARRALLSVSDKTGIVAFARGLIGLGFEIISTGGTQRQLQEAGLRVRAVSEVSGAPEILGGRVKTLHPAIFGGILAQRHRGEDLATLEDLGLRPIDVVAVNLYPFAAMAARPGATDAEIIEQIDIGGPSLLRAAAKNHRDVYAIVDPEDYDQVLQTLGEGREAESRRLRRRLAAKVFLHTQTYDRAIAAWLAGPEAGAVGEEMPAELGLDWPLRERLRYGENPHQRAAFYADPLAEPPTLAHGRRLHGKEMSYNNYLDGETALGLVLDFEEPCAVIVKHANPCGVGRGETPAEAFGEALAADPVSAFGGIVGLNRRVDLPTAQALSAIFLELVLASGFEPEALALLQKKKNVRLIDVGPMRPRAPGLEYRSIAGGLLVQSADVGVPGRDDWKVLSRVPPEAADWDGLAFAWKVVRWVKSNAIVYVNRTRTLGIGAGQMSRIDAARFGLEKAGGNVAGGWLASDGFFPFRDVVDLAARAGVRGVIQPGGSLRDAESVAAADEAGLILVITGRRRFRH